MPRNYSVFLDAVRLFAALMVLFGHFTMFGHTVPRFPIEHDGVVIFFLLSGYVIAYCAHERETSLRQFGIARIARVMSVAVPALLLTILLDLVGMQFDPSLYPFGFEFRKWYLYIPMFLSFSSELWFLKISAFSNTPYWSLVYEVWYYILFGVIFFLRGAWRALTALAILIFVGPKILLLAPLWFSGFWLYRIHHRVTLSRWTATLLVLASLMSYGAIKLLGFDQHLDTWVNDLSVGWVQRNLSGAQFFLGDYLKGICIFLFLFAARYCMPPWLDKESVARWVRFSAQYSFSLYLFHFPILVFLEAIQPRYANGPLRLLNLAVVALVVFSLGGWCERQKGALRRILSGNIFKGRFNSVPR